MTISRLLTATALALTASLAQADQVKLADGSNIIGTVTSLQADALILDTAFANTLTIQRDAIVGITTDTPIAVTTATGERVIGKLAHDPDRGTYVTNTAFGDLPLDLANVRALTSPDAPLQDPAPQDVAAAQAQHAQQIKQLETQHAAELAAAKPKWTGRAELGLSGESGNSKTVTGRARLQGKRETESERLKLYLQGRYAEDDSQITANEWIGGAGLERDITDRLFVFGSQELEYDELENLDLRSTTSGGLGYFVIRKPHHEFKPRLGVGFIHESFSTGITTNEIVAELGYDYRIDLSDRLRLTQNLTWYPTFADPTSDFRVTAETAAEFPISNDANWLLRAGVKNDYDNQPAPGVEELDTYYFLNLVYKFGS